jgi:FkbM family methyltransferase
MKLRQAIKHVFRACGIEIQRLASSSSEEAIVPRLLSTHAISYVIDVGANTGQYGLLLRSLGYAGRIISFEPLSAAHTQLKQTAGSDQYWTIGPRVACGEATGSSNINVAANSVSSSLLAMLETHADAAPHSVGNMVEQIAVARLDDLVNILEVSSVPSLLKIDTQGFELSVLRGAQLVTSAVQAIQIELSFEPLYDGQARVREIIDFLDDMGFELYDLIPGFRHPRTDQLLQADGIFTRRRNRLLLQ